MQNNDYTNKLKDVLSDHFDAINQPVSISLGLHLKGQTVKDIVNLLRYNGINAVPYYDEQVRNDLSCFVVDGTGIREPLKLTVSMTFCYNLDGTTNKQTEKTLIIS